MIYFRKKMCDSCCCRELVEGIGENKCTYLSNFTLQKPINHPPVRLDVIYDVTHYSTLALESCYPRVTVSIFS